MSLPATKQRDKTITAAVRAYGKRLFRFIRNRVPTNADAEDILQEVWYQLSRVVDTTPIEQLSGWLFQVARNKVTDSYRKQRPDLLEDYTYENDEGEFQLLDILMADSSTPEMENLKQIFWEELFEALEELPEAQRDVFIWNELEDQTFQEISDRTGVNIKTLISRKRYAVKHLRERLQNLYEEFLIY